jgi:hypothetical protein
LIKERKLIVKHRPNLLLEEALMLRITLLKSLIMLKLMTITRRTQLFKKLGKSRKCARHKGNLYENRTLTIRLYHLLENLNRCFKRESQVNQPVV